MNILVLNYEYPPLGGGAAPVCRDITEGMSKEGHKVTVVTMAFRGLPQHELQKSVEIFRVPCLRRKAHSCMPWEAFTYILAANLFLNKLLRKRKYDVCHAHFVLPTGLVAFRMKNKYGLPYLITAHGSDVEGYNQKTYMKILHRLLKPIWRMVVKEAYAVTAPSEFLFGLMNREMKGGFYVRVPNGLELSKYRTDPSIKEKRILLMGRMQKAKNFQTVLKAVSLIPDEIWKDWTVDILGDGPFRGKLEGLCRELNIVSRIKFHGWVKNGSQEQIDYIRRATVYVSASRFENCPMAVLETIAAGCYPLLSDIEGHKQFLRKNPDIPLFRVDDAVELAELLEERIKRRRDYLPLEIDISAFDIRTVTKQYIELLNDAYGGHS